ncbi:MAG TPA: right-handed parallel beta-helix repeat-containing protein, partial [Gemmatimonadaceae bacterium]
SLVFNNGRQRVTDGYAHGIYTQNDQGAKLFQDNIVFHQFAFGFHAYGESGSLRNMTFDGNVSFENGGGQPDFFIGGMTAASNMTLTNNMTWHEEGGGSVWMGYDYCGCTSSGFTIKGNYFVGGSPVVRLQHIGTLALSNNTIVGPGTTAGTYQETGSSSGFSLSGNAYYGNSSQREFQWSSGTYTFSGWKAATGFGSSATYGGSKPSGTKVFVRKNKYERGRANVIIYNWARLGSVSVDLSGVLQAGDHYEIRNVQDWFGTPVASGTYGGGSVAFPMTGVTSPTPKGGWVSTPPVTGPDFNVFVVLKK